MLIYYNLGEGWHKLGSDVDGIGLERATISWEGCMGQERVGMGQKRRSARANMGQERADA